MQYTFHISIFPVSSHIQKVHWADELILSKSILGIKNNIIYLCKIVQFKVCIVENVTSIIVNWCVIFQTLLIIESFFISLIKHQVIVFCRLFLYVVCRCLTFVVCRLFVVFHLSLFLFFVCFGDEYIFVSQPSGGSCC